MDFNIFYVRKILACFSGFRCEVGVTCALLGYYATSSGNFLPTFRDDLYFRLQGQIIGFSSL
jgi:hypothetical protein